MRFVALFGFALVLGASAAPLVPKASTIEISDPSVLNARGDLLKDPLVLNSREEIDDPAVLNSRGEIDDPAVLNARGEIDDPAVLNA